MIFLVMSCLLNAGLDLLFVGGFHWGVFGAAFATMLSQLLAGAGSLLYAYRTNPCFRLSRRQPEGKKKNFPWRFPPPSRKFRQRFVFPSRAGRFGGPPPRLSGRLPHPGSAAALRAGCRTPPGPW